MPSGAWRAQVGLIVVQECEPETGRWGGCVCTHASVFMCVCVCVYTCMCVHACKCVYGGGIAYIPALHSLPQTLPWTPSWATLEHVFTAQWVLTGVSGRAGYLAPQSAHPEEPSEKKWASSEQPKEACHRLCSTASIRFSLWSTQPQPLPLVGPGMDMWI